MFGFEKIAERRIMEAQMRGEFDNLPGAGKPLSFDDDANVPQDLRLAYKILKNAGCLPPELEIKREIASTEQLLSGMKDTREKYRAMKKVNHLIMKFNMMKKSSGAP